MAAPLDPFSPPLAAASFLATVAGVGAWMAPWIPGTRLQRSVGALGAGVMACYLLQGVLFVAQLPASWGGLLCLPAAAGWFRHRRALQRAWTEPSFRWGVVGSAVVVLQLFLALAAVRTPSGSSWASDWLEHFGRARFFTDFLQHDIRFLGIYPLTARPPLANLAPAAFLDLFGRGYAVHAFLLTALNALVVPVLFRLLEAWRGPLKAGPVAALVALLLASPLLFQNTVFPWTKLVCAFFCLAALDQFVRAVREGGRGAMVWAAALAAGGVLAHYSAGPFIVAMAAWLVAERGWRGIDRALAVRLAAGAGVAAAILATWLGWAVATYGLASTFGANTTVVDYADGGWQDAADTLRINAVATFVPKVLLTFTEGEVSTFFDPMNSLPHRVWNEHFLHVHGNLLFAGTSGLWAAVLAGVWRLRGRLEWAWLAWVGVLVVVGIAAHGGPAIFGVAHVSLQALSLAGVVAVVAWCGVLPRWTVACVVAGATVDLVLGVGLGVHLLAEPVLPQVQITWNEGLGHWDLVRPRELPGILVGNWLLVWSGRYTTPGDLYGAPAYAVWLAGQAVFIAGAILVAARSRRTPAS